MLDKCSNVTLSELKDGAVEEQFQLALRKAIENALDPNTETKAKRVITIKVDAIPTPDRSMLMIDVTTTTKLAQAMPVRTSLLLKTEDGRQIAVEPQQDKLFTDRGAN